MGNDCWPCPEDPKKKNLSNQLEGQRKIQAMKLKRITFSNSLHSKAMQIILHRQIFEKVKENKQHHAGAELKVNLTGLEVGGNIKKDNVTSYEVVKNDAKFILQPLKTRSAQTESIKYMTATVIESGKQIYSNMELKNVVFYDQGDQIISGDPVEGRQFRMYGRGQAENFNAYQSPKKGYYSYFYPRGHCKECKNDLKLCYGHQDEARTPDQIQRYR